MYLQLPQNISHSKYIIEICKIIEVTIKKNIISFFV